MMKTKKEDIPFNMLYKIAWSFHYTTGFPFNDLKEEATIAYCEALHYIENNYTYVKDTTLIYTFVENHLKTFIRKKVIQNKIEMKVENIYDYENNESYCLPEWNLKEFTSGLTDDAKEIINIILSEPEKFIHHPPKLARGVLLNSLRIKGWKYERIWLIIRELRKYFKQTN